MAESMITKRALASALKELMVSRPVEKISVGDICEKCGMNRKSFYYHFQDKYDLVNWIFYSEFLQRERDAQYETAWDFFADICAYFYENRPFYLRAFEIQGQNSFSDYLAEVLHPLAFSYLMEEFEEDEDNRYYADFFTDAFRVSIERWLRDYASLPPDKIVSLLKKATRGIALRQREALDGEEGKSAAVAIR